MIRNRSTTQHRRRGAAMVEMALVLPIFLMVVMGIVEFGRALWVANMVTNAARESARMAILDGSTNAEVTQAATDFLTQSLSVPPADVSVQITITAAPGNTDPANQCANAQSRDLINVRVSIPFNKVALIPGNYLNSATLVGRSSMRHE
jgi:Flp pilus assembly protein TadG